ncbi:MAG: hypothetical protein L0J06_12060, partial [Yaniella sp.]|nr:hypothetical protein [Yaniella sp.]
GVQDPHERQQEPANQEARPPGQGQPRGNADRGVGRYPSGCLHGGLQVLVSGRGAKFLVS